MTEKTFVQIAGDLFVNKNDIGGLRIESGFTSNLHWMAFSIFSKKWLRGGSVDRSQFLEIIENLGFNEEESIWFRDEKFLTCVRTASVLSMKDHLKGIDIKRESISIKTLYSDEYIRIDDPTDQGLSFIEFASKIKPFSQTPIDKIAKLLKS